MSVQPAVQNNRSTRNVTRGPEVACIPHVDTPSPSFQGCLAWGGGTTGGGRASHTTLVFWTSHLPKRGLSTDRGAPDAQTVHRKILRTEIRVPVPATPFHSRHTDWSDGLGSEPAVRVSPSFHEGMPSPSPRQPRDCTRRSVSERGLIEQLKNSVRGGLNEAEF